MKAKDLLTAIQVDAAGELMQLSTYTYVFINDGKKETNQLTVRVEEEKIILTKQPRAVLTLNQFILILNHAKESEIYAEDKLVYGYRLTETGILLG